MSISLTTKQAALLEHLIESGCYASESEAVDRAMELLQEEAQLVDETRQALRDSIAQGDRGEAVPFDQALVDRIKSSGRGTLAARRSASEA